MDKIIGRKLPARRKLKAMKSLLDEFMALQPPIGPQVEQAINCIRTMQEDDERFTDCRTFHDYINRAVACSDPPAAKADGDNHDRSPF